MYSRRIPLFVDVNPELGKVKQVRPLFLNNVTFDEHDDDPKYYVNMTAERKEIT